MSLDAGVGLVIVLMLVAANLPFVNHRLMAVGPRQSKKSMWVRLAELLAFYALVGGVAMGIEHALGQIYPQRWEFYATTSALFQTLAFPGFVYRYLLRR